MFVWLTTIIEMFTIRAYQSYLDEYLGVKVTQHVWLLCDPMDDTVHGILQTTILEWVAFPFSRGSSLPRDQTQVSCIAGIFFTSQATREAHLGVKILVLLGERESLSWKRRRKKQKGKRRRKCRRRAGKEGERLQGRKEGMEGSICF